MSEIALHPTNANRITCVPDYFIDEYMVGANGEYVKIYLYLLRCLGRANCAISISNIADALDHTQKDVRRALHYWEDHGLLELEYNDCDELTCIFLKEPEVVPRRTMLEVVSPVVTPAPAPAVSTLGAPVVMPAALPAPEPAPVSVDEELRELLYFAEKLMGHTITADQIDAILNWHDTLGHSWSLIEYIIEYSVEKGAPNIKYMDKIAVAWANEGIHSVDEAKSRNNAYLSLSFAVKSAFGITGRNLAPAELEFLGRWSNEYKFSNEIIMEACRRTILKTHVASFEYADSILKSWFESGIKELVDLEILDKNHAAKKSGKPASGSSPKNRFTHMDGRKGIDYKSLEKTLLQS